MRTMPSSPRASLVSQSRCPCTLNPRGTTIWKSASHVVFVDGTNSPIRFLFAITSLLPPLACSEPAGLVHHVAQRPAREEPAAVVEQDLEAPVVEVRAEARRMRRDEDAGGRPQRMVRGQRLSLEDVEGGAGDLTGPQRLDQVVEPCRQAASDVDEERG